MHDSNQDNLTTMMTCSAICSKTISHCLDIGGEHASKEHINLLMDCAMICELTANFAIRGSTSHQAVSQLCADICTRCADSCEQLGKDNEEMQHCADACRRCAEECQKMTTA